MSDGTLKITTEYKENGKYGPGYYTGMLNTKGLFEQTHGYFEIRCILPKAEACGPPSGCCATPWQM